MVKQSPRDGGRKELSMKCIKLKHSERSGGVLSLQNPACDPGTKNGVTTFAIIAVPDEVSAAEVCRMANVTVFLSDKCIHLYRQLGYGKIVR